MAPSAERLVASSQVWGENVLKNFKNPASVLKSAILQKDLNYFKCPTKSF